MIKSSDKNKLPKLYVETDKQKNSIVKTATRKKLQDTTVKKYLVAWDSFTSTQNFGTDWETMIIMAGENNQSWVGDQYIAWEINFGVIAEKFLPFIKIEVVTNNALNLPPAVTKFFSIDTDTNETILKVGVFHTASNLKFVNPLKAKLFVIFDRIPIIQKQGTPSGATFAYTYEGELYR